MRSGGHGCRIEVHAADHLLQAGALFAVAGIQRQLCIAVLVDLHHADAAVGEARGFLAAEVRQVPVDFRAGEAVLLLAQRAREAQLLGEGGEPVSIRLRTSRPSLVVARHTRKSPVACSCHCRLLAAGSDGHLGALCALALMAVAHRHSSTAAETSFMQFPQRRSSRRHRQRRAGVVAVATWHPSPDAASARQPSWRVFLDLNGT